MTDITLHQNEASNDDPFITFTFGDGQIVRAILLDRKPWFVRQDVLELLDLKSNTSARSLPPDEVRTHTMRTNGKLRDFALINEAGFYRLVFQSRKEEAEKIKTWVCNDVLPAIREKGYYARPGVALPSGDSAVNEVLAVERERLAVERERLALEQERLDLERAKHALSRFPDVSEIERNAVRSKLTQMVEAVAIIRGVVPGRVWRELYLAVRARNHLDLYAQSAAGRRLGGKAVSILQNVETWGLLDMVYTTARAHFMDEIVAQPVQKRLPQVDVPTTTLLPTAEEEMAYVTLEFMMGREPGSLN